MKKSKHLVLSFGLLILLGLLLLLPNAAAAYSFGDIQNFLQKTGGATGLSKEDPGILVGKFINALLTMVGALFVALFIYAGISWMISAGIDEKINKAKKTMTYAVLGIFIVIGAYSITYLVTVAIERAGAPVGPAGNGSATNACNQAGGSCTNRASCTGAGVTIIDTGPEAQACSQDPQSPQICCKAPYTAPAQRSCGECGQTGVLGGSLNPCDDSECKGIKSTCLYCPNLTGLYGKCFESISACQGTYSQQRCENECY